MITVFRFFFFNLAKQENGAKVNKFLKLPLKYNYYQTNWNSRAVLQTPLLSK